MNIYSKIYYTLCESRKQSKNQYKPFSGLHKHHILPKHSGGKDEEENFTYLTVREHIIAHFLLWKIHKNPNDLRSMKMLGAKLTTEKRKIIGEWCRDNKIGFHSASPEEKRSWTKKSLEIQKQKYEQNNDKNWYYWSTYEGRKERAIMGGKASISSGNNKEFLYWMSPEGIKERAIMGGKVHKGKKCMYKPGDKTFIRVSPENVDSHLSMGYVFGSPIISPNKNKKTNIPSPKRKKVSDGNVTYESLHEAATKNNVSVSAIVHRCKSKNSSWHYVS